MPRYKILLEYDGTGLFGWQKQQESPSVQQHLEEAIEKFSSEKAQVFSAGRTDAGVHAKGMVAHFDLEKTFKEKEVRDGINFHIKPNAIAVLHAEEAGPEFHSRFDAKMRHYEYRIINRVSPLALDKLYAWHIKRELDADSMDAASKVFLGKHDFTSFRATLCQAKSPVKTISGIGVKRSGEEVILEISALSFLHHMVRNIVGTLREVGWGRLSAADIKKMIEAKDRTAAGITAPAHGLYFMRAEY